MKHGFGKNAQISLELAIVLTIAIMAFGGIMLLAEDTVSSNQTVSIQNQARYLAVQTSQKISSLSLLQNYSDASLSVSTQKIKALQTHFNETCTIQITKNPNQVKIIFDPDGIPGNADEINNTVAFSVPAGIQDRFLAPITLSEFSCGQTLTVSWISSGTINFLAS